MDRYSYKDNRELSDYIKHLNSYFNVDKKTLFSKLALSKNFILNQSKIEELRNNNMNNFNSNRSQLADIHDEIISLMTDTKNDFQNHGSLSIKDHKTILDSRILKDINFNNIINVMLSACIDIRVNYMPLQFSVSQVDEESEFYKNHYDTIDKLKLLSATRGSHFLTNYKDLILEIKKGFEYVAPNEINLDSIPLIHELITLVDSLNLKNVEDEMKELKTKSALKGSLLDLTNKIKQNSIDISSGEISFNDTENKLTAYQFVLEMLKNIKVEEYIIDPAMKKNIENFDQLFLDLNKKLKDTRIQLDNVNNNSKEKDMKDKRDIKLNLLKEYTMLIRKICSLCVSCVNDKYIEMNGL